MEVGGGLGYAHARWGLALETQGRVVVAHSATGFEEWGAGVEVRYDPGEPEQGLKVVVAPRWGRLASGVEQLWSQPGVAAGPGTGAGPGVGRGGGGRLRGDVSYGWGGLRPFGALELEAARGYGLRTGVRGQLARLNLAVVAEQQARGLGPVTHGLRLELGWRY